MTSNKRMTMKKTFLAFLMISSTCFGQIKPSDDLREVNIPHYSSLAEFVENEATEQSDYVTRNASDVAQVENAWYFYHVRLRIYGEVGLAVPIFASFTIFPRLEFWWKRKVPKGYMDYYEH
jgi:hypothetical protein